MKTIFSILLVLLALVAPAQVPPPSTPSAATTNSPPLDNPLVRAMMARTNRTLAKPSRGASATNAAPAATLPATIPTVIQQTPSDAANPTSPPAPGQVAPPVTPGTTPAPSTTTTAKLAAPPEEIVPAGAINWPAATIEQVLTIYSEYVGRTVLRHPQVPTTGTITLKTQTPLTKTQVIQAIEASLAMNNISLVNVEDKFVKVMPSAGASGGAGRPDDRGAADLPELGSYVTHVLQLKYAKPSEIMQALTPFATPGMQPAIPIDSTQILILRDNAENVKRMLEMVEKIDVVIPAEIISEVIPIKFAKAEDIASALNSVGGGGTSATVGTPSRSTGATGATSTTARPGQPGYNPTQPGVPGAAGMPSSGASFSDRLNRIISRAASPSSSGDLQILGTTKIIADVRANSLLVFASRQDMAMIKDIVSKIDVVLAQVLIETIIMNVSLKNDFSLGVSAIQTPTSLGNNVTGAGGVNANKFFDFSNATATNAAGQLLGSGLRYFGKINENYYVTLEAMEQKGLATVVQKPRILTSHAKEGKIFLGESRAIVSSTYYNSGFNGGPSSSYSQQEAGINLTVTPYVNNEGLVVMEIVQEISDFQGTTTIQGVGEVPNIVKRNLSGEVAVNTGESVILGGIILNRKDDNKSGVPMLKDIPLLGTLFSSRKTTKDRSELIVLMRPTVLKTPDDVAVQTQIEKEHMPGIMKAEDEFNKLDAKEAERAKKKKFKEVTPFSSAEERMFAKPPLH